MYLLTEAEAYQYRGGQTPYVLDITPLPSRLAVISTDQTLCVFDPLRPGAGPERTLHTSHGNITAARTFDFASCVVATAGENGTVTLWDLRDAAIGGQASVQAVSCDASLMSLACESRTQSLAVGTEYANNKASIMIWDVRFNDKPRVQYDEVHSDDVTELRFHPSNASILLSGSTDGLANVCDTAISDEDEVVMQAFNHGASIHRAGFLSDTEVFALSHDEKLALYDTAETQEKGVATVDFGDMRGVLACQYVANVCPKLHEAGAVIGAGSQDQQSFQLIHLSKGAGTPSWSLDTGSVVGLPGAHGGEIVRTFCFLDEQKVVYTGGEDGQIKAWRP